MSGRNFSWNKENYKRFGKVLKSSLKWAQAEVSSFSGSVFMFIRMRLVNFSQWRIFHIVFLQTGSHFHLNLPCLFFSSDSIIVHIQKVLPKSFNLSGYRSFWLFSFKNNVAMFQMYEIRVRKKWTFQSKLRRQSSILKCCHFQTNKARKLRHHSDGR